MRLFLL